MKDKKNKLKIIKKRLKSLCYSCEGTGKIGKKKCRTCNGTGIYKENYYIHIVGKYAFGGDTIK